MNEEKYKILIVVDVQNDFEMKVFFKEEIEMKNMELFVVVEGSFNDVLDESYYRIATVRCRKEDAIDTADLLQGGGYDPWYDVSCIPYHKGRGRITYIPVVNTGSGIIVFSAYTNKVRAERALRKAGSGYIDRLCI